MAPRLQLLQNEVFTLWSMLLSCAIFTTPVDAVGPGAGPAMFVGPAPAAPEHAAPPRSNPPLLDPFTTPKPNSLAKGATQSTRSKGLYDPFAPDSRPKGKAPATAAKADLKPLPRARRRAKPVPHKPSDVRTPFAP